MLSEAALRALCLCMSTDHVLTLKHKGAHLYVVSCSVVRCLCGHTTCISLLYDKVQDTKFVQDRIE
jgi:hypothetical protein